MPIQKMTAVDLSLRLISSPATSSLTNLQYWTRAFFCGKNLRCNHKVVGYFYNVCATIAILGIPYMAETVAHSIQREITLLLIISAATPATRTAPSGTMKSSHRGESFQVSTNMISLCPMTRIDSAFSSGDLPSRCGPGKCSSNSLDCLLVGRGLWNIHDQQPKGRCFPSGTRFSLATYGFWEEYYPYVQQF